MNPIELFHQDGKESGIFYCSSCRIVAPDRGIADKCCRCMFCGEPIEKENVGKEDRSTYHGKCWDHNRREREAKALASATVVSDYDGWVFVDGLGYRDGYFPSLEELVDYLEDERGEEEGDVWPERAYCCEERPFPSFDVDDIIDSIASFLQRV